MSKSKKLQQSQNISNKNSKNVTNKAKSNITDCKQDKVTNELGFDTDPEDCK